MFTSKWMRVDLLSTLMKVTALLIYKIMKLNMIYYQIYMSVCENSRQKRSLSYIKMF